MKNIEKNNMNTADAESLNLIKIASSKIRSLMKIPKDELMKRPHHEVADVPSSELMLNPDRAAEHYSSKTAKDYKKMRDFHNDDISTMQNIRDERDRSQYAQQLGKNPDSFIGDMKPGVINDLIGENEDAVFNEEEIGELERLESSLINESRYDGDNIVKNLPHTLSPGKFDEKEFHSSLYRKKPPYDQDVA